MVLCKITGEFFCKGRRRRTVVAKVQRGQRTVRPSYDRRRVTREVLHSEFRNYFRNVAAGVEKVVELSEVWWRKCMVFRK